MKAVSDVTPPIKFVAINHAFVKDALNLRRYSARLIPTKE